MVDHPPRSYDRRTVLRLACGTALPLASGLLGAPALSTAAAPGSIECVCASGGIALLDSSAEPILDDALEVIASA